MRVVMFYHSLVSDWNHGNAHFLRGVASELLSRRHDVRIFEPRCGWSFRNLVTEYGDSVIAEFRRAYPNLDSTSYDPDTLDLDDALDGADLVLVHEWNEHSLVRRIGEHRARRGGYRLLFHDTHHRAVTDPASMGAYDLSNYDGVLAFGRVLRDLYLARGWAKRAWIWHEAADTRVFHPLSNSQREGDLVWIGNWGDDERTSELREFLIEPVRELGLKARVYGVRYPEEARRALADAGIEYCGWLPNFKVAEIFSRFRLTVHIPRGPYVRALPGIPTIRVFEALACGIPLISAPWSDAEGLFAPGRDFFTARDGRKMVRQIRLLLDNPEAARALSHEGRNTIRDRHTCGHRVNELLSITKEMAA